MNMIWDLYLQKKFMVKLQLNVMNKMCKMIVYCSIMSKVLASMVLSIPHLQIEQILIKKNVAMPFHN